MFPRSFHHLITMLQSGLWSASIRRSSIGRGRMWIEDPKHFSVKVEQAVEIYNHTPRSRETEPPTQLWHASEDIWDRLLSEQREERQRANWRTRFRRVKGNVRLGQKVWIWKTKTVTLKDKLEPWWVGLGLLEGKYVDRFGVSEVQGVESGFVMQICYDHIGDRKGC